MILDCDGLLVESEFWQFEARRLASLHFGHHLSEKDFLYFWFDGNGGGKRFCAQYGIPLDEYQAIKHRLYDGFIEEKLTLRPGVEKFLDVVKKNYKVGLFSNSEIQDLEKILGRFSLRNYFDTVVSGNDIQHGKPDPEGYLLAARRMETEPSAALVFENSHIGLAAALAAGMKCVVVPDEYGRKYQFNGADRVLNQIDEALGLLVKKNGE